MFGIGIGVNMGLPAQSGNTPDTSDTTPSTTTIAQVMSTLGATGYWPCSDASGATLTATTGSNGTIVGVTSYHAQGSLYNVASGGFSLVCATNKYLRVPTGTWFSRLDNEGIWLNCKYKYDGNADGIIASAFKQADFGNAFVLRLNYSQVSTAAQNSTVSFSLYDPTVKQVANDYFMDEQRFRDGNYHDIWVYAQGTTSITMQLWFDGVLLTPTSTLRTAGYDFTSAADFTDDLMIGGYSNNGAYNSLCGNNLTIQCIGIGISSKTEAQVVTACQPMYYTNRGIRSIARFKPSPTSCFTDAAGTTACTSLAPNTVGQAVKFVTDMTGNAFDLIPDAYSEAHQVPATLGYPNLARDESGVYYLKFNNQFQGPPFNANVNQKYQALNIDTGSAVTGGTTAIPAFLSMYAIIGTSQGGGALYQVGPTNLLTLDDNQIALRVGPGVDTLISTKNPVMNTSPIPILRDMPTMSFAVWYGCGDGVKSSTSVGRYFVDGTFAAGSDTRAAGNYTVPQDIATSTIGTYAGGVGDSGTGSGGFAGRIYEMGIMTTPYNDAEVSAAYASYLTSYGVSTTPEGVLLVIGDSITSHQSSYLMKGYQSLFTPDGAGTIFRRIAMYVNATPGDTTTDALGRDTDNAAYKMGLAGAEKLTTFIYLGTNDCSGGVITAATMESNLTSIKNDIVTMYATSQFYIVTIPSNISEGAGGNTRSTVNAWMVSSGIWNKVISTPVVDLEGGLHPTDTGHGELAVAYNPSLTGIL